MIGEDNLPQSVKNLIKSTEDMRRRNRWAWIETGLYRGRRDGVLLIRRPYARRVELTLFAWQGSVLRAEGENSEIERWTEERLKIFATLWADMVAKNFDIGRPRPQQQ